MNREYRKLLETVVVGVKEGNLDIAQKALTVAVMKRTASIIADEHNDQVKLEVEQYDDTKFDTLVAAVDAKLEEVLTTELDDLKADVKLILENEDKRKADFNTLIDKLSDFLDKRLHEELSPSEPHTIQ